MSSEVLEDEELDWDDVEWDEWMALTDEQREAAVDREVKAYSDFYNSLSLSDQIAHCRRITLDSARSKRRLIRLPNCPEIIRETSRQALKATQVRLLKIRVWRATGVRPGES